MKIKTVKDVKAKGVKMEEFIDLYKIEGSNEEEKVKKRREYLERALGISLKNIGSTSFPVHERVGKNIENPIGTVQLPVGVAGPIKVNGDYAKGSFYLPLATTEGALVASVNRGMKLITSSGGAYTKILRKGMARSIVFEVKSLNALSSFFEFVDTNLKDIKNIGESVSSHLKIIDIQKFAIGNKVYLRVVGDTGDAMGMNMLTIACAKIGEYIQSHFDAKLISVSANMCVDKKPNSINLILGRGRSVTAEARIPQKLLHEEFGVSIEDILSTFNSKIYLGSALSGSIGGFNAHVANLIAASFIALGQDAAQVVESSMAILNMEKKEDNLYASILLPSLEVGTVGGGTSLPFQSELLDLVGCKGSGGADKLAEIITASALAAELNLIIALTKNELASAHEKLGRNKPI